MPSYGLCVPAGSLKIGLMAVLFWSGRESAFAKECGMLKYRQYCPVARASEIFADRWTPLIVRELLAGSHHFNGIERGLPAFRGRCLFHGCGILKTPESSNAAKENDRRLSSI